MRSQLHYHPPSSFPITTVAYPLAFPIHRLHYMSQIRLPKITLHYRRCVIGPISNIAAHFLIPRFDTSLNGARGGGGPLDVLQYHSSTLSSSSPPAQILISFPRGFVNCKNAHDHLLQQQWHRRIHDKCKPSVVWKCCHCKSRRELSRAT